MTEHLFLFRVCFFFAATFGPPAAWCCVSSGRRVSDEKDARGYLQALTGKMTEEMENLKLQGMAGTPSNVRETRAVLLCSYPSIIHRC